MDKKFIIKNGGFPPIKFCEKEDSNINNKKERFYQDNIVHNVNIRQLLTSDNKKLIILPKEDELAVADSLN